MRISSLRITMFVPFLIGLAGLGVVSTFYLQRQSEPVVYAASEAASQLQDGQLPSHQSSPPTELQFAHAAVIPGDTGVNADLCPAQAGSDNGNVLTSTASQPSLLIDLNSATAEELTLLPGIGPAYAERIIALRTQRSGFVYKEELLDVPGIGPTRYARLVDLVTVGPYTQAAQAAVEP